MSFLSIDGEAEAGRGEQLPEPGPGRWGPDSLAPVFFCGKAFAERTLGTRLMLQVCASGTLLGARTTRVPQPWLGPPDPL